MSTSAKLGIFGLSLLVLFAAAWGVGRVAGPYTAAAEPMEHDAGHEPVTRLPGGLQVAQDGYRLELLSPQLSTSEEATLRFRILGPDGLPVTKYRTNHDKDLHLIVVGRDLSAFQHVHPTLDGAGVWSVPLKAAAPGAFRVIADFQPSARDEGLVLGADIAAPGGYQPVALPPAQSASTVDGYTVTLEGKLVAGKSSTLRLSVSKDGTPVTNLQPYLGAYGHLVALRSGDLAYLHVHPHESTSAGPQIAFEAEVPSEGDYRLYLDFRHGDTVHTAEFTARAGKE